MCATTKSPFPWLPMIAISIALVNNSYVVSNLFPYMGYMVQYLGVTDDKDEAGFYAGYVSSALMVGRFGSSYLWGRFADRYGRLPVMYISLCAMVVLPIAFGMSTSFYWAIVWRFLLGAMNGLLATSKTMISEVCTKEHEVIGMSMITGPSIGGLLSEPAKQYPRFFSEYGLFGRFPYLLPNVVGACFALVGLTMVFFFLHETKPTQARNSGGDSDGLKPLPTSEADIEDPEDVNKDPIVAVTHLTRENSPDYGRGNDEDNLASVGKDISPSRSSNRTTVADDSHDTREATRLLKGAAGVLDYSGSERHRLYDAGFVAREAEMEAGRGDVGSTCWTECLMPIRLLSERKVRGILFVYGLFAFIKIGLDEVYPLWALSTIANGGLDWTTNEIGKCLSITGLAMLVFQMIFYPPLIKAAGIQLSQRVSAFAMVLLFMATPLLSFRHDKGWLLIVANVVILFFINIAANTIFINIALAINNAVDPLCRGTLNGVSMTTTCLARAAGPPFFAVVFAWSINRPRPFPFDFRLAFYLMAVLMAVVVWASWDVIRVRKMGKDSTEEHRITPATDKEADIDLMPHREER